MKKRKKENGKDIQRRENGGKIEEKKMDEEDI